MQAIIVDRHKNLTIQQYNVPTVNPEQVLIKIAAAGINRPDIMQRQGLYPPPVGASDILGLEVAGTIVALGNNTTQFKVGDKVCALITGGGYAQYCIANIGSVLHIPDNLSMIEAAALPETFFTVWSNLFDRAHLKQGESLLVHGGSSGIGTTAIQLAKAFGIKVFVTVGSEEKRQYCLQLGADIALNYKTQDFVEEINTISSGKGVDVILDMIGGDYFPRNLKCLALEGRLVQIAIQKGAKAEINLWALMLKRQTITGSTLRAREPEFKAAIAKQLKNHVWELLSNGKIKPQIYKAFPLANATNAHQLMESSLHTGKIILTVDHQAK
ncbi:MAG: zinc-binding dehydrogenase [Methylococcaceae bacterium]|nr:zinc-binding dehydrogenase [Methylococcaceae bacterium]